MLRQMDGKQMDGKQILKFYIRLLLYIDDIHNKYRNIEIAKSSSGSDSEDSFLKFTKRERKSDLIEQLKDNLKYNKENPYGVSIDNTLVRLFEQKKQEPAQTASEVTALNVAESEVKPKSTLKLAQAAAALPLAALSAVSDAGLGELDE